MKIRINTKKIKALNPCQDRLDNWLKHYKNWSGDILEFLALPDEIVPYSDKLWVTLRVVPQDIREYFAIDMAIDAANTDHAVHVVCAAAYVVEAADNASYSAAHAAEAAYHAADAAARTAHYDDGAAYDAWEGQCQKALDTLAYLIATH